MYALSGRYHKNELMQEDFDLYGKDSFQMEIVQQSSNFTRSGIEGKWIVELKSYDKRFGYNYKDPYVWHRCGYPTRHIKKELQGGCRNCRNGLRKQSEKRCCRILTEQRFISIDTETGRKQMNLHTASRI